jgi:glycosyltransferase involved in cell wall biosynthesis
VRIGLAFCGDSTDPKASSGTPAGVGRGLEELGIEVVRLRAKPPAEVDRLAVGIVAAARLRPPLGGGLVAGLRHRRRGADASRPVAALRTATGRLHRMRAGKLDGLVQMGTEYHPLGGPPFVTYDDRTVIQADRVAQPSHRIEERALRDWSERQRRVFHAARACCASSQWARQSIIEDYGVPPEKVHVVGAGRNHVIAPPAERDWSTPRYLWIGMEWERKGGPAVVRAFERLRDELPEATLDLVGRHPEVDLSGVRGHGVMRLDVADDRERVRRLFETATCFLTPSLMEPLGLANAEAMGAGLPVVVGQVGGSPSLVGDAGRVVDPLDHDSLLGAMRELADPEVARRLGGLGAERAALYTWRRTAERILRALSPPAIDVERLEPFL